MRFQWCSSVYFPYCLPSNQVYIPPTPYHCITCHLPVLAAKALIWKRHRFDLKCQTNFTHSLPQNANEIRKCLFFAIKHATSFLSEKLTVFWTFCKKCSKNFKGREYLQHFMEFWNMIFFFVESFNNNRKMRVFYTRFFFANYISQIDFWGMHSMSDAFWTKKKKMQYLYYVIEHACTPWLIGSKSQTLQIDMKRRADLYISLNPNH